MNTTQSHIEVPTLSDVLACVPVEARTVRVFGKVHAQPRLTKWYGPVAYTYSGLTLPADTMPGLVRDLRDAVAHVTGSVFNSVLVNLYRDGSDCVGWHADTEALFGARPAVASVSVGSARTFKMRLTADHSVKQEFTLGHGALLLMPPGTQEAWEHSVPRTAREVGPRVNFTFRSVA